MFSKSTIVAALVGLASAAVPKRQSISTLSASQISSYTPYTYFAAAAKCDSSLTQTWSCGVNCKANPSFIPVAAGGDGGAVQYWYVGYDPAHNEAIVAHQGTNTSRALADLTDAELFFATLDPKLFPGVSSSVQVHAGFSKEQAKTATQILSAVQNVISTHGTSHVTTVGQSLGAALALLDSVYLRLQLPANISVNFVGYGLPRAGNQQWADLVDRLLPGNVTHINNQLDPIPTVPGLSLGYHHPSGEIHIEQSGDWDACPGQDNHSDLCIVGAVPYIWTSNETNHDGPYNGIETLC